MNVEFDGTSYDVVVRVNGLQTAHFITRDREAVDIITGDMSNILDRFRIEQEEQPSSSTKYRKREVANASTSSKRKTESSD
jgi:hypothetical protein